MIKWKSNKSICRIQLVNINNPFFIFTDSWHLCQQDSILVGCTWPAWKLYVFQFVRCGSQGRAGITTRCHWGGAGITTRCHLQGWVFWMGVLWTEWQTPVKTLSSRNFVGERRLHCTTLGGKGDIKWKSNKSICRTQLVNKIFSDNWHPIHFHAKWIVLCNGCL